MWKPLQFSSTIMFVAALAGCATTPPPEPEGSPAAAAHSTAPGGGVAEGIGGGTQAVIETVRKARDREDPEQSQARSEAKSITIDCSVKLPDDPTDNPELCRSFQLVVVDETGKESPRFRFGAAARYRYPAKSGKRYRVRPVIGKNWEFKIDPDRDLVVGDRAHVQLKQKE